MEFTSFPGEHQYINHDQHQTHYNPHEVCWCKGANNLMDVITDLKSSLRSLIKEEVEEVVKRVILPHLSTPPSISRSLPHYTETSASKKLYLRIDDTTLPETLFTMNKIQHQVDSLKVELVNDSGVRVEDDLESSAKIKMVVLNGDFEAEDNDWSEEDFDKNLVQPRKDKAGSLLKGKCEIALSKGVVDVGHISFTDNSKRNGTFRLGAQVIKNPPGVNIKAAVSKPFAVKERRLLSDRKHEKPSLEDELWRLKNIRRDGPVYERAKRANICTVKDFLQQLHTDPMKMQKILEVPQTKWRDIVENAEACMLTDDHYKYYDETTRVDLVLNCVFDIENATFTGQATQLYGSLNDYQKQIVNETRRAAYKNRGALKPYNITNQMQTLVEVPGVYSKPSINMQHHEAPMQIQGSYVEQGDPVVHSCTYMNGLPSYLVDHNTPQTETCDDLLQDNDAGWIEMFAGLIELPEIQTESNSVTMLRAACRVSMAAEMINNDHAGDPVVHSCTYMNGLPSYHVNHNTPQTETCDDLLQDDDVGRIDQMCAGVIELPEMQTESFTSLEKICKLRPLRVAYHVSTAAIFMIASKQDRSSLKRKRKLC